MIARMLVVAPLVLAAGAGAAKAAEETVTARAAVVDGNTLRLDGHAIRLWGIAVPPANKPDGMRATIELFRLVDGRIVSCHMEEPRSISPRWGKCEAGGLDVGALMVDNGAARDCVAQTNARYRIQEQRARSRGSQIGDTLELPAHCERAGAGGGRPARKNPAG
jgi:endonuclease YncB( thermonuclease family)